MKMPCEVIIWHILPSIRREMVNQLLDQEDISQTQAAKLMNLTPAAVSQYQNSKRGREEIKDPEVKEKIAQAAKKIAKSGGEDVGKEICEICSLIRKKGIMDHLFEDESTTGCPA